MPRYQVTASFPHDPKSDVQQNSATWTVEAKSIGDAIKAVKADTASNVSVSALSEAATGQPAAQPVPGQ